MTQGYTSILNKGTQGDKGKNGVMTFYGTLETPQNSTLCSSPFYDTNNIMLGEIYYSPNSRLPQVEDYCIYSSENKISIYEIENITDDNCIIVHLIDKWSYENSNDSNNDIDINITFNRKSFEYKTFYSRRITNDKIGINRIETIPSGEESKFIYKNVEPTLNSTEKNSYYNAIITKSPSTSLSRIKITMEFIYKYETALNTSEICNFFNNINADDDNKYLLNSCRGDIRLYKTNYNNEILQSFTITLKDFDDNDNEQSYVNDFYFYNKVVNDSNYDCYVYAYVETYRGISNKILLGKISINTIGNTTPSLE